MHSRPVLAALLALLSTSCVVAPAPASAPARPPAASPDPNFVAPTGVTIPPGTTFMVRMYDSVDSVHNRAGSRWTATLEANLSVDGQVVAPRGSVLYGVITDAKSAGRLAGKSSLTLTPTDLLIGSDMYSIVAGEISAVGAAGAGANTAGRTIRGAAIGGLINGSRGARTGAKIGLGASILSKDGQIQVPSGTLLEFPLAQPLSL